MAKRLTHRTAQEVLRKRHSETKSWKTISSELGGLNRGYLSKVASGKARASDHLIALMNDRYGMRLTFNSKPAQPCAKCGQLHEFKSRCPSAPRKPRRTYDISYKRLRELLQSPYLMS